jgi:dihydrofolate synthase/folylpolyglutamate synthase
LKRTLDEWLRLAESVNPRTIEMGLTRVSAVANRMGLLPWRIPSIIVAGTNGKGSVTATAESILRAAGYSTGAGFSPHVHRFNERIRVDGEEADDALIVRGFEAVECARETTLLTYFEFATLASLWIWRETGMDCTVIEIGLGGRLDAFNIVDAEVAVITSIGLDHQDLLGNTREAIGGEKAGVFRPHQRVVLGRNMPDTVNAQARELACHSATSGREFLVADREDAQQIRINCPLPWSVPDGLESAAPCQLAPQNTALATMAAAALKPVTIEAVRGGLARASMPGRTESFRWQERTVVVDIAHNPDGAIFLDSRLAGLGLRPDVAILGNLRDKDTAGIAAALVEKISCWIAVSTPGARGQEAVDTAAGIRSAGALEAVAIPTMRAALECAVQRSGKGGVILVFGSFAAVGAAREILLRPPVSP